MTCLGQRVTPSDLDLWSNFDLTFQAQQVYVSTRLDERNTKYAASLFCSNLFAKKRFVRKTAILTIFDP